MTANESWAMAVEKLADLPVPRRGYYLRALSSELCRISSHCIAPGAMAMDTGAITPFPYVLRERAYINDLIEQPFGRRLAFNYHRIGGGGWDMPLGWDDRCCAGAITSTASSAFDRLITNNGSSSSASRTCASFRATGDRLGLRRAEPRAGVDTDVRRDVPLDPPGEVRRASGKGSWARSATAGTFGCACAWEQSVKSSERWRR